MDMSKLEVPSMKIYYKMANTLFEKDLTFENIFYIPQLFSKDKVAFIYEVNSHTIKVTYKEYLNEVKRYASTFDELLKDIKKDTFVGLKMTNSPRWCYTFYGLLMSGYKPLLINPILNKEDTNKLIKESGIKLIITENDDEYDVKHININNIVLSDKEVKPCWANEVAFTTSGTTGDSRIFIYDGKALSHQMYSAYTMPLTSKDIMYVGDVRLLAMVPFSHIFGFVAIFFWYTFFGATLVFPKSINPDDLLNAIKKHKCTHVYSVPLFFERVCLTIKGTLAKESEKKQKLVQKMIDYNDGYITKTEAGIARRKFIQKIVRKKILGNSIRYCIAGGSALSKDVLKMMNGLGYPLYNGYGMTEVGVTSVELSPKVSQRLKGSVGKPLYNIEYKVVNNELLIKAPQIHIARLKDGKRLDSELDKDGYFHTGDIALIDEEGYTYIKGKSKDVIIASNGENIYPDEIEIKFKNLPYVANLSVISPAKKQEVVLIVNLDRRLNKEENENLSNEIKKINETLPLAMQVKETYVSLNTLPMNASMKIMRHKLIESLENEPSAFIKLQDGRIYNFDKYDEKKVKDIIKRLTKIVSEALLIEEDKIGAGAHIIFDLNGDSFSYMSILSSVEEEFKITIPSSMIGKLYTINDFAMYILDN